MRTSLNDIKEVDDFLTGNLGPEDAVWFQARLVIDPLLRMKVLLLKNVYTLIRLYGRKKLKDDLEEMHQQIFQNPDKAIFRQRITDLFPERNLL